MSAIEAFERAAELSDYEHEPFNNLGLMLQESARHKEAVQAFQRALDRAGAGIAASAERASMVKDDPGVAVPRTEVASVFVNMGVSLCDMGELESSLEAFEAALRYDPTHAQATQNERAVRAFLGV